MKVRELGFKIKNDEAYRNERLSRKNQSVNPLGNKFLFSSGLEHVDIGCIYDILWEMDNDPFMDYEVVLDVI